MAMEVKRREKKMKKGGDPVNNGAAMFRSEIMDNLNISVITINRMFQKGHFCCSSSNMDSKEVS